MSDKPEVPQDLREQYERLTKQWHGSTAQKRYANPLLNLIERIGRAESKVAENAEYLAGYKEEVALTVRDWEEKFARLESDLSALRAQLDGKWISVEKCPNKTDVLFCWPESGIMAVGRMEHRVMRQGGYKKDYFWGGHQFLEADDYPPTHWQPLPTVPTGDAPAEGAK